MLLAGLQWPAFALRCTALSDLQHHLHHGGAARDSDWRDRVPRRELGRAVPAVWVTAEPLEQHPAHLSSVAPLWQLPCSTAPRSCVRGYRSVPATSPLAKSPNCVRAPPLSSCGPPRSTAAFPSTALAAETAKHRSARGPGHRYRPERQAREPNGQSRGRGGQGRRAAVAKGPRLAPTSSAALPFTRQPPHGCPRCC